MRQSKSLGSLGASSANGVSGKGKEQAGAGPVWPAAADAYELLEDCGRGVSATVWRARCVPNNKIVAVKILNLEAQMAPLEDIVHEAQTMKAYKHEAILGLYVCFVDDTQLWMVMPYMEGGSVAHILRYRFPDGLQEAVIATIMKEVLGALAYIHGHGDIHRDVKAGNVLVDAEGHVKLGDFGVAASMERQDWGAPKARNTFVGTPCWMAPEVLEQDETHGYGPKADIWSCGITMLEMAHGHAPFSKLSPMKILLQTLQGPPPQLEAQCGGRHFSRGMREVVASCLNKDPAKRPTAKQLLSKGFFRQAKDAEFLRRTLLAGLPPLPQRCVEIRMGKGRAATQSQDNERRAVASQISYITDVAQWDFNCTKSNTGLGSDTNLASWSFGAGSTYGEPAAAAASSSGGRGDQQMEQQQQQPLLQRAGGAEGAASALGSSNSLDVPGQQQQQGVVGLAGIMPQDADTQRLQQAGGDAGAGARDVDASGSSSAGVGAASAAAGAAAEAAEKVDAPVTACQAQPRPGSSSSSAGGLRTAAAGAGGAAPAHARLLTCYAGNKPITTIPVSVHDTPIHSPMHSRPATPEASAAAAAAAAADSSRGGRSPGASSVGATAGSNSMDGSCSSSGGTAAAGSAAAVLGAKQHGRFVFVEGSSRYQGPDLLPNAAAAAAAARPFELSKQRSVSSPDMSLLVSTQRVPRTSTSSAGGSTLGETPLSPLSPASLAPVMSTIEEPERSAASAASLTGSETAATAVAVAAAAAAVAAAEDAAATAPGDVRIGSSSNTGVVRPSDGGQSDTAASSDLSPRRLQQQQPQAVAQQAAPAAASSSSSPRQMQQQQQGVMRPSSPAGGSGGLLSKLLHNHKASAAGDAAPSQQRPQSPLQQQQDQQAHLLLQHQQQEQQHPLPNKIAGFLSQHGFGKATSKGGTPFGSREASPRGSSRWLEGGANGSSGGGGAGNFERVSAPGAASTSAFAATSQQCCSSPGGAGLSSLSRQANSLEDIYGDAYSSKALTVPAGRSPRSESPRMGHSTAGRSRDGITAAQLWQQVKDACAETASDVAHMFKRGQSRSPERPSQQQQQQGTHVPTGHERKPQQQHVQQPAALQQARQADHAQQHALQQGLDEGHTAAACADAAAAAFGPAPTHSSTASSAHVTFAAPVSRTVSSSSNSSSALVRLGSKGSGVFPAVSLDTAPPGGSSSCKPPKYQQGLAVKRVSSEQGVKQPVSPQRTTATQQQQPAAALCTAECPATAAGVAEPVATASPAQTAAAPATAAPTPPVSELGDLGRGELSLKPNELCVSSTAADNSSGSSTADVDRQHTHSQQQQQQALAVEPSLTFPVCVAGSSSEGSSQQPAQLKVVQQQQQLPVVQADGLLGGAQLAPQAAASISNQPSANGIVKEANLSPTDPQARGRPLLTAADAAAAAAAAGGPAGQQATSGATAAAAGQESLTHSSASPSRRHKGRFTITEV